MPTESVPRAAEAQEMLADAEAQWRTAHPDAKSVEARAWHEGFVKFSARELNRRWKRRQGGR
ncbi:MAG: hypothetical protein R2724_07100 [Bryobacterales bacterium]